MGTAVPPWMPNHGIQEPADAGDRSPAHHGRKRLPLFRGEKKEQSSAKLPEWKISIKNNSRRLNLVCFAHHWNAGILECWALGFCKDELMA